MGRRVFRIRQDDRFLCGLATCLAAALYDVDCVLLLATPDHPTEDKDTCTDNASNGSRIEGKVHLIEKVRGVVQTFILCGHE